MFGVLWIGSIGIMQLYKVGAMSVYISVSLSVCLYVIWIAVVFDVIAICCFSIKFDL